MKNTDKSQNIPPLNQWQIHSLHKKHLENPDYPALFYQDQVITYKQLEEKVEQFAQFIHQKGLLKGERVALAMPNCPAFVYAYLGITRAGGVALPLHLLQTPQELIYILEDSKARFLVISAEIAEKLKSFKDKTSLEIIVINSPLGIEEKIKSPAALPLISPDDIATFLYTSGTTGKPKAAMLSHKNLVYDVICMDRASDFIQQDNFLAVLPMFHSFGWSTCILLPFYLGCSVTILDAFRPKEIIKTLSKPDGITVFCGVPSMFNVLTRFPKDIKFPSLKFAVSGGDSISKEVIKAFEETYKVPIMEGYGLSEASPVVSFNPIYGPKKVKSIGFPLPGIEVKIVNEAGEEVSTGEIGELIVKGDNIMQGYYNLPEETNKVLKDKWLYTGDLASRDKEGYLFIAGRSKELIITAGFNVYPKEVEEALLSHPHVKEAAVIGIPNSLKGEDIKAFIIPEEGCSLTKKELSLFLKEKLANYKIPEEYVFTEELPYGITGKVLKRLLK